MFEEELKEFGLTDNEVKIYLLLLKNNALNPYFISDELELHRGYVYDSLKRMEDKGVVSTIFVDGKKNFQAVKPDVLVEILKLKLDKLKEIVPKLKAMGIERSGARVDLHKGKKVYRTLIKDVIATAKKGDILYLIGIDEDVLDREVEPIYMKQYLNTIKQKNIKERVIIKKESKQFKNPNIKYKTISKATSKLPNNSIRVSKA